MPRPMRIAKKRIGTLIFGRGSNVTSLIAAAPDDPAKIVCVLSNHALAQERYRVTELGL